MTQISKNTDFTKIIPISVSDIDINKIVVSNKFPFGKQDFTYFIGYKDSEPLCVMLDLYPYSVHKWLYLKKNLMNLLVNKKGFYWTCGNFGKSYEYYQK